MTAQPVRDLRPTPQAAGSDLAMIEFFDRATVPAPDEGDTWIEGTAAATERLPCLAMRPSGIQHTTTGSGSRPLGAQAN